MESLSCNGNFAIPENCAWGQMGSSLQRRRGCELTRVGGFMCPTPAASIAGTEVARLAPRIKRKVLQTARV